MSAAPWAFELAGDELYVRDSGGELILSGTFESDSPEENAAAVKFMAEAVNGLADIEGGNQS